MDGNIQSLIDHYDQLIKKQKEALNQEYRDQQSNATTKMTESAGFAKGAFNQQAERVYNQQISEINAMKQREKSFGTALTWLEDYPDRMQKFSNKLNSAKQEVISAEEAINAEAQKINKGIQSTFENDDGFNKLKSNAKSTALEVLQALDFSNVTAGQQKLFTDNMTKMFDSGKIDKSIEKLGKLQRAFEETGNIEAYNNGIKKLIPSLGELWGVSEDVVTQMVDLPKSASMASSALDDYLRSFGKMEGMTDKQTQNLTKTFESYNQFLNGLSGILTNEKYQDEVDGEIVYKVDAIMELVNTYDLPEQVNDIIAKLSDDGKFTYEDMEILTKLSKIYVTSDEGERERLIEDVQNAVDKEVGKGKIDVGKLFLTGEYTIDEAEKKKIEETFNKFKQFEGKEELVTTITSQIENSDEIEKYAQLLDGLNGEDKDIENFITANIQDLSECKTYEDMVKWLINHPDIMNEYNINVIGEETIQQTQATIDNLLTSDDEKDIRINIDKALAEGDIKTVLSELDELPPEKKLEVVANIIDVLDGLNTVDSKQLSKKFLDIFANDYEAWAQIMAIEGKKIPDKPFTIIANSNIDAKIAEIKQKVQNMKPSFTITGYIEYVQSGGKKKNGHVNSPVFKDYNPNGPFSYSDFTNIGDNPYAVDQVSTMNLASPEPVMQSNAVATSNTSSSYGGISTYASDAFDIRDFIDIGKIETIKTPISLDYQNVLDMLEYSVELFKELEYRIQNVTKKTSLLDKQMEKAIGTEKIKYLEQKNKLLEEQQKLQKEYYDSLISERETLQKKLKESGFTFNEEGNMENYEEKLLAMQKEYKRLQDLADKSSKGSSSSSNNTASDKASKYKEELDKLTSLANKYYEIQQSDIYSCEEQWLEMKNTIKENNDEIEKLTREDKLYKFNNAITKINNQFDILKNKLDVVDAKLENANGLNTIKLTEEKLKLLNQQLKKQEELVTNLKQKIPVYQDSLSKYGFKFDIEGNVDNLDEVLNNFQNNEDLEKVNDLVEEYIDLINSDLFDAEKDYIDLQNDIIDLQKDKLDKVKDIEDEITKVIEDEIDKRKDAIEDQYDKEKELIEQKRDEYKKKRDEDDYGKDLKEQQDKIDEINRKIELARRDNSIAGKSKLQDLLEELKDEQDSLNEKIQNKVDDDMEDMFDKQLEALDKKKEDILQQMEDTYTPQKIAQMVQDAMMTNTFTDLNGNITNLQDKLIEFAETSGDAIGILGDSIKTELCDNLSIALNYVEDYSKIFNELGLKQLGDINYRGNMKDGSVSKTLNTGDFIFNVDGNMDDKALNDMRNMIKQTLQDIVNKSL